MRDEWERDWKEGRKEGYVREGGKRIGKKEERDVREEWERD